MTFQRKLVKLEPGEVATGIQIVQLPDGFRLETDDEFRARIKTELRSGHPNSTPSEEK